MPRNIPVPYKLTEEQRKLAADNYGLAWQAARRDVGIYPGLDFDELLSIAGQALCKAASKYRPEVGPFQALAPMAIHREIRHAAKRAVRDHGWYHRENDAIKIVATRPCGTAGRIDVEEQMSGMSPEQKRVVGARLQGYTLKEIKETLGIACPHRHASDRQHQRLTVWQSTTVRRLMANKAKRTRTAALLAREWDVSRETIYNVIRRMGPTKP